MSVLKAKKYGYLAAAVTALVLAAQGCSDSTDQAAPSGGAPGDGNASGGSSGKANGSAGDGTNGACPCVNNGSAGKANTNGGASSQAGGSSTGGASSRAGGSSTGGASSKGGAVATDGGAAGSTDIVGVAGDTGGNPLDCTSPAHAQFLDHECFPGGCPASFDNPTLSKLNEVGTL